MNSLEGIKKEHVDLKKIVERLRQQGIKAAICKRPIMLKKI
ncbi:MULTISPECIES: hypothetical protein [Neobacillus]|nr:MULTISPECIES: hypothetical protein [Neobacillus]